MERPYFMMLLAIAGSLMVPAQAQQVSVVFPLDCTLTRMSLTPSGGFVCQSGFGSSVVKFNANMQQQWAVDLAIGLAGDRQYFGATSDDGAIAVGEMGPDWISMDSVQDRIYVNRLSATGTPVYAKLLEFPVRSAFWGSTAGIPSYPFGNALNVSPWSESFISLPGSYMSHQSEVLKLDAQGQPQWRVGLAENHMLMSRLLPDESGGCYFASQAFFADGSVTVGHIAADGTLGWCHTYSRDNAFLHPEIHLRTSANGTLVLAAMEGNNLLWMEMDPGGTLLQYRLFAQIPGVPQWIQDGVRGLGQLTNGEWVILHGSYLGSRLTFLAEDGSWSRAYNSPAELHGGWYGQLLLDELFTHGNNFTVHGTFRREEAVFNFTEDRPVILTLDAQLQDQCLFIGGDAAQMVIPVSSINVIPQPTFLTLLVVPTATDTILEIHPGGNWPVTDLCSFATALADPLPAPPGIRLLGNPIAKGGTVVMEADVPVLVELWDLTGRRMATTAQAKKGRMEIPLTEVAAGNYLITAMDRSGVRVYSQHLVVQ